MHQGGVFPDRQARDLSSRNSQTGGRGRTQRRRPYLVARESQQQENGRAAGQGRDRKRFQRRQAGDGRGPVAVFSLSATAAWSRGDGLSRVAQRRDLLLRRRLL